MDRENLISILNRYYKNQMNTKDAYNILYDYCIEKGKSEKDIKQFLNIIGNSGMIINLLPKALEYYENKFSICKVIKIDNTYDISNNTILLVY